MKRIICLLLCLMLVTGLTATVWAEDYFIDLGQTWDSDILAGGIYDLYAWVGENEDDYTYQWQVDVGFGEGHWSDLEDNADPYGYSGTKTYHLQLITPRTNGYVLGSGWENIPFRCLVTHKKTGATRGTADMFMRVFTSDDLEAYMAKKGIELYEPGAIDGVRPTTTDYETYYASAESGKVLTLLCGCKPPQKDPLLSRSDATGQVEVWITEEGKTVKRNDGGTYMPYTIGKDAVTIQYKLRYSLGIHDLGYYQTKTVKLSTTAPEIVGRATTKQAVSLLKEPYGQSQKLTSLGKGAVVYVHKNSGSWYQVSTDKYIGYVDRSALNYEDYTPVIEEVDVKIAEPLAGNKPATSNTTTPDSCFVTSVEWLDLTEDRFLEDGDRFIKGHDYQLVLWISAKPDYRFKLDGNDNVLTKVMINGNRPGTVSRAYEQIIGKVIDVRYDFKNVQETDGSHVCKPKAVAGIPATCTTDGCESYYKCSCGKTYADEAATREVFLGSWGIIPATGHREGAWYSSSTQHYKKCATCKQVLTDTYAPHTGGEGNCLQQPTCDICNMKYGNTGDHKWSPRMHPVDATGHAYQCADCKGYDTVMPHTPGPEATDKDPQLCTVCQYIITPAKNHTHKLQKVEAKAATCLVSGNLEYYTCDGCNDRWLDAEGTKLITDPDSVILTALGHFTGEGWDHDSETHWQTCVVCMQPVELGREVHTDSNSDGACDLCGYIPEVPEAPEPTQPQATQVPVTDEKPAGNHWLLPVLVALVSFAAAVTVTVIILKQKK